MAASCNRFTTEQIEILRHNPYVRKINTMAISFTVDFKRRFWEMYTQENLLPREIFELLGVDIKILGSSRIKGIPYELKQEYMRFGEFSDVRRKKTNKQKDILPAAQEINKLRLEVEYLKQEQEFIKKIISAAKEVKSK